MRHPTHELAIGKIFSDNFPRFAHRARPQPWLWRFAKNGPIGKRPSSFRTMPPSKNGEVAQGTRNRVKEKVLTPADRGHHSAG